MCAIFILFCTRCAAKKGHQPGRSEIWTWLGHFQVKDVKFSPFRSEVDRERTPRTCATSLIANHLPITPPVPRYPFQPTTLPIPTDNLTHQPTTSPIQRRKKPRSSAMMNGWGLLGRRRSQTRTNRTWRKTPGIRAALVHPQPNCLKPQP